MDDIINWCWGRIREARVIKAAPYAAGLVALLGGLIGVVIGYKWKDSVDETAIRNLNTAITTKDSDIASLKGRLESLEAEKKPAPKRPRQLPTAIYQMGQRVADVQGPQIDRSTSTVRFSSIVGAVGFDPNRDFEFQNLKLHIKSYATATYGVLAGMRSQGFSRVECQIIEALPGVDQPD